MRVAAQSVTMRIAVPPESVPPTRGPAVRAAVYIAASPGVRTAGPPASFHKT